MRSITPGGGIPDERGPGAIDEDAATIRAEYDATRGHPKSVYIDIDQRIADEEISFEARSLAPLL